ncbi:hypothetical protein [Kitasatospora sp. NPDC087315]|uniref:hypothetical protein n=1 Tax=Kitasatospora sp. NPDC087315 TaxID=3364069 RepID=UPI00380666B3
MAIPFSVFTGSIGGRGLERCLAEAGDADGFVAFVHRLLPEPDEELIRRIAGIAGIVGETCEFDDGFAELTERRTSASVTVRKAAGDNYSFTEGHSGYSAVPPGGGRTGRWPPRGAEASGRRRTGRGHRQPRVNTPVTSRE